MSIGLYIVLAPLYLKSVRKLQEKRFVFVKILAIIIPENGAKVSKIKCFQFAQQTLFKETLRLDAEMMGSTLAGLYFTGNQVWTVNVGDSRCFLLRDGKLRQISEDQTDEAYMKENGIQGRKPYLTQYMGMNPEEVRVLPYMDCLQTKRGDRFLICSDGVSDMVPVDFLETMIQQTQSTAKCVDAILTAALDAGGKDNITAIVLEINR